MTGTDGLISTFTLPSNNMPSAQANANFGNAVALTSTHALIGVSDYNHTPSGGAAVSNSGNAYLYHLNNGSWINLLASNNAPTAQDSGGLWWCS